MATSRFRLLELSGLIEEFITLKRGTVEQKKDFQQQVENGKKQTKLLDKTAKDAADAATAEPTLKELLKKKDKLQKNTSLLAVCEILGGNVKARKSKMFNQI